MIFNRKELKKLVKEKGLKTGKYNNRSGNRKG